jgi:hypothetical protein
MILDDIQTQHIDDILSVNYIWGSGFQMVFFLVVGFYLFSGGDFEIISNNMKTMSNILILIYCSFFLNSFKWITFCFTKNMHIIYA